MFSHLDRDAASVPETCDLLVVGAGPAGICLALEAARARPDWLVVLAEAGGMEPPAPAGRDALSGHVSGAPYPLEAARLRYFGGTSGHWGGWSRPLDGSDYLPGPDGGPGWPIAPEELAGHLDAAHRWCEIPVPAYDAEALRPRHPRAMLDLRGSAFENGMFRFSPPTRFGTRYRTEVEEQANLHCVLGANAVGLGLLDARCDHVMFRGLAGTERRVRAARVALAMGGLETTRLLLHAAQERSEVAGLRSDVLGRYFADHIGLRPGQVLLPAELRYARFDDESGAVMPVIVPRPEALRENGWLNACMMLSPMPAGGTDLPSYTGNRSMGMGHGSYWRYSVQMILEPTRHADSRVRLHPGTDRLGMHRLDLQWLIDPVTVESGLRMFDRLAREVGRMQLGRARIVPVDKDAIASAPSQAFHHMGTTRMSPTPEGGVVDSDLRVHGTENLFIASSSVFPRYGYSNPTLTIVALACRLASHVTGRGSAAA